MSRYTDMAMERRSQMTEDGRPVCNCAQAVACVFAHDAGYDEEAAGKAAVFFRGGMQSGMVCGAVTGSLIALGMSGTDEADAGSELIRRVRAAHDGMLDCRDLLRVNHERGGEKLPHCNAMICECIGYTEEILRRKGKI